MFAWISSLNKMRFKNCWLFILGFKILNMHRSRQDFFPTLRKAINEIKIYYLHINSITICNLNFGCSWYFLALPLFKIIPITFSRAVMAPTCPSYLSWINMQSELCKWACQSINALTNFHIFLNGCTFIIYSNHSHLFFGNYIISFQADVQQGDPLGPFLIFLGMQVLISKIKNKMPGLDLTNWYMNNGSL